MDNRTVDNDSAVSQPDDFMNSTALRAALIVAYSVVFVLGVAGNTLVIFVVVRNSMMQTITNIFIANLAVSDITMCLLAVPFTPISGLLQEWPFGDALCHLVPMTLGVSVYVSTLTSIAIAVDRYCVIVHPFLRRMRVRTCLLLIVVIWLIAVTVSLPMALYQDLVWNEDGQFYSCEENWPGPASRKLFTVISLVLQYIVPCVIITYCYARVSAALRRRARGTIGTRSSSCRQTSENDHSDTRNQMKLRRKRRTNRMLIAMVAIFAVCWLPLNVILLTLEYDESLAYSPYFLFVFFAAHVVAMSSTVYNPFLYAWMNDNFRKEFRRVFPCLEAPSSFRCGNQGGSMPYNTTMPPVTNVNIKYPSPSRYSSATCRTEPQGGSCDRGRSGRGPRTVINVDEQTVRFAGSDHHDNNEDENYNIDVDTPMNVADDDNGPIEQPDN